MPIFYEISKPEHLDVIIKAWQGGKPLPEKTEDLLKEPFLMHLLTQNMDLYFQEAALSEGAQKIKEYIDA